MSRLRQMFISQDQFDAWANGTKRVYVYGLNVALIFIVMCVGAAMVIMGPRLVREGSLLWFGLYAEGTIQQMTVEEAGKFKGGAQRYRLTLDYSFTAANGVRHDGTTFRTDVRDPPDYKRGDPIGVYYSIENPANSVAEHNLRTDVYALALFLPFLAVLGIGWPIFWAVRFTRWRRGQRTSLTG